MTTRIIPKTHLRDRIRDELADLGDDTLVITDRGRPVAVVVAVSRWNDLQESILELDDAVTILEHRARGERGQPAERVFAAIEAEEADVPGPARQTG
ncbi:MAG: type II toxin-antitoxin system prevent-host-death family antitoxin [Acidimicrobiales bacterium]